MTLQQLEHEQDVRTADRIVDALHGKEWPRQVAFDVVMTVLKLNRNEYRRADCTADTPCKTHAPRQTQT